MIQSPRFLKFIAFSFAVVLASACSESSETSQSGGGEPVAQWAALTNLDTISHGVPALADVADEDRPAKVLEVRDQLTATAKEILEEGVPESVSESDELDTMMDDLERFVNAVEVIPDSEIDTIASTLDGFHSIAVRMIGAAGLPHIHGEVHDHGHDHDGHDHGHSHSHAHGDDDHTHEHDQDDSDGHGHDHGHSHSHAHGDDDHTHEHDHDDSDGHDHDHDHDGHDHEDGDHDH